MPFSVIYDGNIENFLQGSSLEMIKTVSTPLTGTQSLFYKISYLISENMSRLKVILGKDCKSIAVASVQE